MKVITKKCEPTFDLVGLTLTELKLIHRGVGKGNSLDSKELGGDHNTGFNLYEQVDEALRELKHALFNK